MYAAVADVTVDGFLAESGVACVCGQEFGCDGGAHGIGMTLSQGAGGVLDAALGVKLGVSAGGGAPLAEAGQLIERVLSSQAQLCVEHGRHVAGVEEETVASFPEWPVGVVGEVLAIKDIDEICSTHGSAWMAALGFLHRTYCKDADIVCREV